MQTKTEKKAKSLANTGILLSWSTFWFFLLLPFGLVAWVGILFSLIGKKVNIKRYLLLSAWIFVPGCSFVTGSIGYFTGSATLGGLGGPQTFHGIDRETRAVVTTSGCIVLGFELFIHKGNNLAVAFWTSMLGYQRGAYAGVYPTEEEAVAAFTSADTLTVTRDGNFYLFKPAGQTIKIDSIALNDFYYATESLNKVVGKVLNDECFIFQPIGESEEDSNRAIYLLDIKASRILTMYADY